MLEFKGHVKLVPLLTGPGIALPALHGRVGPTPHHGHGKVGPDDMGLGGLALPLTCGAVQWTRPTSSATTQTHILDLELAHPSIYPIYDLLEGLKELVLWTHSPRLSMTQGSCRIPKRSFGECPVMVMGQRP